MLQLCCKYRKSRSKATSVISFLLRKDPAVAEAMANRHITYNRQMQEIAEREEKGISLVIRPPEPLKIRRTENDPEELERVYQIGRKEAEAALPKIKSFLADESRQAV